MEGSTGLFAERGDSAQIERGEVLSPKFDADGLIPAIVTDHASGEVLMFAFMNAEALGLTIRTREAHFYSRSRGKLWKKGESSGNVLAVRELRVDCDQDCLWVRAEVGGHGATCHVGYRSCFYRAVELGETGGEPRAMAFTEDERVFDPDEVYGGG